MLGVLIWPLIILVPGRFGPLPTRPCHTSSSRRVASRTCQHQRRVFTQRRVIGFLSGACADGVSRTWSRRVFWAAVIGSGEQDLDLRPVARVGKNRATNPWVAARAQVLGQVRIVSACLRSLNWLLALGILPVKAIEPGVSICPLACSGNILLVQRSPASTPTPIPPPLLFPPLHSATPTSSLPIRLSWNWRLVLRKTRKLEVRLQQVIQIPRLRLRVVLKKTCNTSPTLGISSIMKNNDVLVKREPVIRNLS